MDFVIPSLAVVAITELYQRIMASDWKAAIVIIIAGLIGIGAGFLGLGHLDPLTGFMAGEAAVGIHTTGQAFAGK